VNTPPVQTGIKHKIISIRPRHKVIRIEPRREMQECVQDKTSNQVNMKFNSLLFRRFFLYLIIAFLQSIQDT
jgi:hypothetical protein